MSARGAVLVVVLALAATGGCAQNTGTSEQRLSSTTMQSSGYARVIVGGRDLNVHGQITCAAAGSDTSISIGDSGVTAMVGNGSPPMVHTVSLGVVDGTGLNYTESLPGQGRASAVKTDNSYTITGEAVGMNPATQLTVTKPFEVNVSCP